MGLRHWVNSVVKGGEANPDAAPGGALATKPAAEAPLAALGRVAQDAEFLGLSAKLLAPSGETIRLDVRRSGHLSYASAVGEKKTLAWKHSRLFGDAMTQLAAEVNSLGRLDLDSVSCRSGKSPVRGVALRDLCVAALCEAFGETVPTAEELAARRETAKKESREKGAKSRALRKELLGLLDRGQEGVAEWNRRHKAARGIAPLRRADLSGKDLTGIRLVDVPEARLGDATLVGANLGQIDLRRASFAGANLEGADLSGARVQGADFTGARLDGARWTSTQFDESTIWPAGFALPEELRWTGKGPSPAALAAIAARKKVEGPVDLGAFMERLKGTIEKGRLDKALSMLKKDRFQLFVEVTDQRLAGIVKSQSDPDLVYSCLLGADGRFSCCTQNLNVCGGLRGAVCKHLLVLIVGVAQSGGASPDVLDDWVQRSALHQPVLQKDAQSAVLLKYKGAEAGEIDWRPTETVPEDFYAY